MPLNEDASAIMKHCVVDLVDGEGKDVDEAHAICTSTYQENGYMQDGSHDLTSDGKALEREKQNQDDHEDTVDRYEQLIGESSTLEERAPDTRVLEWLEDAAEALYGRGTKVVETRSSGYAFQGPPEGLLYEANTEIHVGGNVIVIEGELVPNQSRWDGAKTVEVMGDGMTVTAHNYDDVESVLSEVLGPDLETFRERARTSDRPDGDQGELSFESRNADLVERASRLVDLGERFHLFGP